MTGATGFLGAFLLAELLGTTGQSTRYYCLVRDRGSEQGGTGNRILGTLKSYGLFASPRKAGLSLSGDVSKPQMGLDNERYQELAEEIDLIFHCAASVNYAYPYTVAKPHTVGGTTEVLRFACTARTKTLQYISSNGVFPEETMIPTWNIARLMSLSTGMEGGYNQAKWVAERLVWSAVSRGLPASLYSQAISAITAVPARSIPMTSSR